MVNSEFVRTLDDERRLSSDLIDCFKDEIIANYFTTKTSRLEIDQVNEIGKRFDVSNSRAIGAYIVALDSALLDLPGVTSMTDFIESIEYA